MSGGALAGNIGANSATIGGDVSSTQRITSELSENGQITASIAGAGSVIGEMKRAAALSGAVSARQKLSGNLATVYIAGAPHYDGEYEVTPGEQEQIIYTALKVLQQNITVKPIPSNYGRIAYDGAVLSVF